jgi:SAM-dependent methyltransferase
MISEDYFHQVLSSLPRQGPGYSEATRKPWSLIPSVPSRPNILDIGCGTGAQTQDLATLSRGTITAGDNYEPFLARLAERAEREGLSERIRTPGLHPWTISPSTRKNSISSGPRELSISWGSNGLSLWKQYCKHRGFIVVSDMALFDSPAPEELINFWKPYGVTVHTEEEKAQQIADAELRLLHTVRLEEKGWARTLL